MTFTPFTLACLTYLIMLVAFFMPRRRYFHILVMVSVIIFDVCMPFYLYTHRDWWKQLIEHQDILSFLVWMHFGVLAVMYALEYLQFKTARKMLRGDAEARADHRAQGKAMLAVRALVILSGGLLTSPEV